ncbi:MAG: RNA polymerase sigma factor [Verrucomicrobiales bacterium]|nr:RNA polymerase sigma factor [Verrucomicrobiales bacterium]
MSLPNNNPKFDRENERRLMKRIAEKDADAFQEFEEKYRRLIYSTIYKVLSNHEDVQDITNEVLIKIWRKAHTYNAEKGSLVTWIRTTSRNRAIDHLRTVNRRQGLSDVYKNEVEEDNGFNYECGWQPIIRSDVRESLFEELDKLPAEQKEAVELVYFQGLTQQQVADRVSRPLGTIKARLKRATEKLRKAFDPVMLQEIA